ncbi:sensor histidine kinase [bacterium]|nr:MAG: sensor histidine kinase [bacterium]
MATPYLTAHRRSKTSSRKAIIEQDVRRLVARELHDRVAQTLTGMLVDVENFRSVQVEWEDVLRELDMVQNSTRQVLASLRQLLHDLRGEDQVGDSFVDALAALIERFESKTRITAELDVKPGWPETLTPPASLNLYRIVEEALANVRMHSGARTVHIVLEPHSDNELALVVGDDGRGLDTDLSRPVGLGTVGMKERALFLGGRLQIDSDAGGGTTVHAVFPKGQIIPQGSSGSGHFMVASA